MDAQDLTSVEQQLVTAAKSGDVLVLGPARVPRTESDLDRSRRTLRAGVIRNILLNRIGGSIDPRGVRVIGAYIDGRLDLDNAEVRAALDLRWCSLAQGLSARAARFAGPLSLVQCRVIGDGQPALQWGDIKLEAGADLRGSKFHSDGDFGAVDLRQLDCNGSLLLSGIRCTNPSGPSINADGAVINGNLAAQRIVLQGGNERGTFRLSGANLGGQLLLTRASIKNPRGPALVASPLTAQGKCHAFDFAAVGSTRGAAVDFGGAAFVGNLSLRHARVQNSAGPALDLTGSSSALLSLDGLRTVAEGVEVYLIGTHCKRLNVSCGAITEAKSWAVDGLTFSGYPQGASAGEWRRFISGRTASYAAQPYQHLARVARAAGHDGEARSAMIAQRRDQIARAGLGLWEKAWLRFTGVTLGYGYRPWLSLVWLLGIVGLAIATVSIFGGLIDPNATIPNCQPLDRVGYVLQQAIPLLAVDSPCIPSRDTAGRSIQVAGWLVSALTWGFLTLFVAGFTSAVRKK